MRRHLRPIALTLALAASAGACANSRYEYLSAPAEGVYFKVPKSWTAADELTKSREGRPPGNPAGIDLVWSRNFWTGTAPSPDLVDTKNVNGVAEIFQGTSFEVDRLSSQDIRIALFGGFDPLNPPDEPNPDIELAGVAEVASPRGWYGFRVRINERRPAESGSAELSWFTRDVVYMLDGTRRRLYVLQLSCESTCYLKYEKQIQSIMQSFAVDPT